MIGLGPVAPNGYIEIFLEEGWMLATIVDEENLGFYRLVKMGKFVFFSIYSTHLKLPISKPFFHSHNSQDLQYVSIIKSYIYTFNHKIKLTYLNANKSEK